MENSCRFFQNEACKFYPCHKGLDELNCLFCYCPLYFLERCPGDPEFGIKDGKRIKICAGCLWPHRAGNYPQMMKILKLNLHKRVAENREDAPQNEDAK